MFLVAECADEPEIITKDFLGVDLGIAKIATTSDGKFYSGTKVKNIRRRYFRLRQRLQAKGTKSAKRKLNYVDGKNQDLLPMSTIAYRRD